MRAQAALFSTENEEDSSVNEDSESEANRGDFERIHGEKAKDALAERTPELRTQF